MTDIAVLDFETGGLDEKHDALASVAVIVLNGDTLEEKDRYYTLIKDYPDRVLGAEALRVNGLTAEEINQNGKDAYEVLSVLDYLLQGRIPCAHNAAFDFRWLNARGFNIQSAIDTMVISLEKWVGQKAKLGIVAQRLGIPVTNAHNSLADVETTCDVLRKYKAMGLDLTPKPIMWDRFKR